MSISSTIESYLEAADTGTAHTRRTYRTAMNLFRQYLGEKGIPPEVKDLEDLDVDRLLAFSTWLLESASIGQRTLTTYLAAIMAWVSYLQVRGWLPFTPQELARLHEGIKHVRRNQRPPELIPHPPRPEEMELLVTAARETVLRRPDDPRERLAKLRDIAIVETLRCTGLRVGELVSITRKQLEDQDRAVWVVGKGNKVRRVYFDERSWEAIHHYLHARQQVRRRNRPSTCPICPSLPAMTERPARKYCPCQHSLSKTPFVAWPSPQASAQKALHPTRYDTISLPVSTRPPTIWPSLRPRWDTQVPTRPVSTPNLRTTRCGTPIGRRLNRSECCEAVGGQWPEALFATIPGVLVCHQQPVGNEAVVPGEQQGDSQPV